MITIQTTMSHVQSVTGILLISAKQKCFKEHFVLNQPYEIEPSTSVKQQSL